MLCKSLALTSYFCIETLAWHVDDESSLKIFAGRISAVLQALFFYANITSLLFSTSFINLSLSNEADGNAMLRVTNEILIAAAL